MIRKFFLSFCSMLIMGAAVAQDYSNRGLMEIKEQSEAMRMLWIKTFDAAVQSKDFSGLSVSRKANEAYIDQHLSAMKRLFAQGDARALLNAVSNYLQIERQFVKDAMVDAESIKPGDQDAIDKIYQKIEDFGQKERIFLVEISNAMATEPEESAPPGQVDPEMMADDEEEEHQGSVIEGRQKKTRGKLPHEMPQEKKGRKKRNADEEDEE